MMKKAFFILLLAVLCVMMPRTLFAQAISTWVFYGSDGRLHYKTDSLGNPIMDFSYAGYRAGGVALPNVATKRTVSPSGGDDTAAIQSAINAVSALAPDANGFRGAVLLAAGTFNVSGTLNINTSGIVVRGSGSGSGGTLINMNPNATPFTLFALKGSGSWQTSSTSASMTDSYVHSGRLTFNVDNPSLFNVGDTVLISRPVTQAWVNFMGMNDLVSSTGTPETWLGVGSTITTDRTITAINGTLLTLDAPLTDSFDSALLNPPGGSVATYTFPGRISQVGVEHLSVIAPAVNAAITIPQYSGVSVSAVMNAWAQDLVFRDTQNTVTIGGNVKQVTLENIHVNHTITHTGDRMADFSVSGTQIFLNKSSSDGTGEWPFVTQGRVAGPNAILNFESTQQAGISAHQRWATGLLADNATLPNAPNGIDGGTTGISFSDRGNHGSGQGWAMGWGVAWNVTTPFLVVQMPPGSANWCIGCIGSEESATEAGTGKAIPNGFYDSLGALVTPSSLYLAQLRDRLGNAAIANIGYGNFALAATPSSRTVTAGGSTSYTISVTPSGTFSDSVVLSVSGLPMGASASLTPASLASGNSTLSISTSSSTPAGSYTLSVTGTSGNLAHSKNVTLNVNPSATLPAGWSDTDIGTVGVAGSASFSNGVFTVNGSGSDIWSSADSFNYASESLSGDVTITARVASQQNTNAWAKSGVMIRETTAANSSYVFVFVTPSNGVNMQYRNGTGTSAVQLAQQAGHVAPYWVRLVRSETTFTGFSSADGVTWTQVGAISVTMATNVLEGLAVCAHSNTVLNTSTFDNVTVSVPTGPTTVYQVNSGGPAVTPFAADAFFSGGQTASTTATIDTSAVTNPAPMAVYQTERWGGDANSNPAPFSYTFPNLTPGTSYTMRLHFAEIFWTTVGQRKFNVAINGAQVLTNFDIIAAAGAANKAIVEQFMTTANSSGQIVVSYTVGAADAPKSSGIEIITN